MTAPNVAFRARPSYQGLTPIVADDPPGALHLADNTNAFGAPPAALRTLAAAQPSDLTQYPSSSGPELREAIARYLGVAPNDVILGCGADNVIDCAFRALCEPGDAVAFPDPTFVMARYFAVTNGLRPVPVPLRADGGIDVAGLLGANARVIYLCAPNNPTGAQPNASDLQALLDRSDAVVLLDEAYAEFAGETRAELAPAHPRLVVLRTFSKAFGLAGLRVGYAVGSQPLVREIEKARGPFAVSTVALRAAQVAITDDMDWVRTRVRAAVAARDNLIALLQKRGLTPFPSVANFVLLPVPDARRTAEQLRARGITVRVFTRLTGIGDALRITVGPPEAMRRVADALLEALA